jgi:arginine/serine-rich splicing factor 4/5/6
MYTNYFTGKKVRVATFYPKGTMTKNARTIYIISKNKCYAPGGEGSAIKWLTYYLNRGGKGIKSSQRKEIEKAKKMLQLDMIKNKSSRKVSRRRRRSRKVSRRRRRSRKVSRRRRRSRKVSRRRRRSRKVSRRRRRSRKVSRRRLKVYKKRDFLSKKRKWEFSGRGRMYTHVSKYGNKSSMRVYTSRNWRKKNKKKSRNRKMSPSESRIMDDDIERLLSGKGYDSPF